MTTTTDLALKLIAPHPSNPRRDLGDLTELTASVKNRGVLQNLVVVPAPAGTRKPAEYVLIAGHRRFAAAKAAKCKMVPVTIREDLTDPADQLAVMLEENSHRTDLTPVEESVAVQGLLDLGLSQTKIAALTGMGKTRISERARVAKLPVEVKDSLHTHQLSLADALAIAEFDGHEDLQAEVIKEIGGHNFAWALNRCRSALTRQVQFAKDSKALTAAGVKVLQDFPPEPDVEVDQPDWRILAELESTEAHTAAAEHTGIDPDNLELEHVEAWHQATCPGHAAVAQRDYFETICLTPDAHPDYDGVAVQGDGTPGAQRRGEAEFKTEQALRALAEREFTEGMAAAAAARQSHLQDTLALGRLETAEAYLHHAILTGLPEDPAATNWGQEARVAKCQALAGVLGVEEYSTHEVLVAQVRKYVESATLPQLVILLGIVRSLGSEVDLGRDRHSWLYRTEPWLRVLAGPLGYVFSTFEQDLLPDALKPALPVDDADESVSA